MFTAGVIVRRNPSAGLVVFWVKLRQKGYSRSITFKDFAKQLKVHNRKYNKFPMRPLNWRSPQEIISAFV